MKKIVDYIEPIYRQTYIDLNTIYEETIIRLFNKETVLNKTIISSPGIGMSMKLNNELVVETNEPLAIEDENFRRNSRRRKDHGKRRDA